MTVLRAAFLVLFLSAMSYGNSLGNGFAYDDNAIIPQNPLVTSGDWRGALSSPYQPDALEGAGLYRPLTSVSFTAEWKAFRGGSFGYHLLNLVFHSLVSLLVFLLLLEFGAVIPALVGALLFAVHPVHTEVVANVVGRAEIYAAFFFLAACFLYWRGAEWKGWSRVLRLLGLGVCYAFSLSAKEIGVTLPAVLLLLEAFRPSVGLSVKGNRGGSERRDQPGEADPGFLSRLMRESPVFVLLLAVLLTYLAFRAMVLGTLTGEVAAPIFQALGPGHRVLTAIAIWVQYLRLLLFPLDLAADYAPGVLFPSEGFDSGVVLGIAVILGVAYGAVRVFRAHPPLPLVTLGVLWFFTTILPVSNLPFPTGVLLAERTLYLPSIGLSIVAAGATLGLLGRPARLQRLTLALSLVVLFLFAGRTVLRNPSWFSTFTVLETLNKEHPESHLAFLMRGSGLDQVGNSQAAEDEFSMALRLAPRRYGTLTEVAAFYGRQGDWAQAEALLRRAIEIAPSRDDAYRLLSSQFLRQARGREAHRVAANGLAMAGFHPDLWGALSESYVLKADLPAALRARWAAVGSDPNSPGQWNRLAQILEALGEKEGAAEARQMALTLTENSGSRAVPSQTSPGVGPRGFPMDGGTTK